MGNSASDLGKAPRQVSIFLGVTSAQLVTLVLGLEWFGLGQGQLQTRGMVALCRRKWIWFFFADDLVGTAGEVLSRPSLSISYVVICCGRLALACTGGVCLCCESMC